MPHPHGEAEIRPKPEWWEDPRLGAGIPPLGIFQFLRGQRGLGERWRPTEAAWWTGRDGGLAPPTQPFGVPGEVEFPLRPTTAPTTAEPFREMMIAPGVMITERGYETPEGIPLSDEVALRMYNEYWTQQGVSQPQQTQWLREAQQDQQMAMRAMARQATLRGREAGELDKSALADALEAEMGRFTEARDWIKRWDMEQRIKQLRIEREPVTAAERLRGKEADVASSQAAARRALEVLPAGLPITSGTPGQMQASADILRAQADIRTLGKIKAGEIGAKEGREFKIRQAPTPDWLAGIFSQLTAGEPIFGRDGGRQKLGGRRGQDRQVIEPFMLSGQQFRRLSPSQRQGWAGFVDWLGGEPEAILEQMSLTLPGTPQVPRQWRPARQLTSV